MYTSLSYLSKHKSFAGISTFSTTTVEWLPGFIGPVPPPLLIRVFLLLNFYYLSINFQLCQIFF